MHKAEVNFYNIDEVEFIKFFPKLMEAVTGKNNKVLIFTKNNNEIMRLDNVLWVYSQLGFLPHSTYLDEFKEGVIYLTNDIQDNPINANIAVILDPAEDIMNIAFNKFFYFFPPQLDHRILEVSQKLKDQDMQCYSIVKTADGKWDKKEL